MRGSVSWQKRLRHTAGQDWNQTCNPPIRGGPLYLCTMAAWFKGGKAEQNNVVYVVQCIQLYKKLNNPSLLKRMAHHRRTSTSTHHSVVHLHLEDRGPSFEGKVIFWTEKLDHLKEEFQESIWVQMEKDFLNRGWSLRSFLFYIFYSCFDIFARKTRIPFTHNKLISNPPLTHSETPPMDSGRPL